MKKALGLFALILLSGCGAHHAKTAGQDAAWKDAATPAKAEAEFFCMAPMNYMYMDLTPIGAEKADPMPWAENVGNAAKFLAYSKKFDDCVNSIPADKRSVKLRDEIESNAKERLKALSVIENDLAKLKG